MKLVINVFDGMYKQKKQKTKMYVKEKHLKPMYKHTYMFTCFLYFYINKVVCLN